MTILTTEQQVLELAGPGVVVLWHLDRPFLTTAVYHRFGHGSTKWTLYDPEDTFATISDYSNENLWAIATMRSTKSTISVADGEHKVTSFEELEALPRYVVARVGHDIYQNYGGEWWRMDPESNPEDDTLSPKQLWEWHGSTPDGVVVIWHPSETGRSE